MQNSSVINGAASPTVQSPALTATTYSGATAVPGHESFMSSPSQPPRTLRGSVSMPLLRPHGEYLDDIEQLSLSTEREATQARAPNNEHQINQLNDALDQEKRKTTLLRHENDRHAHDERRMSRQIRSLQHRLNQSDNEKASLTQQLNTSKAGEQSAWQDNQNTQYWSQGQINQLGQVNQNQFYEIESLRQQVADGGAQIQDLMNTLEHRDNTIVHGNGQLVTFQKMHRVDQDLIAQLKGQVIESAKIKRKQRTQLDEKDQKIKRQDEALRQAAAKPTEPTTSQAKKSKPQRREVDKKHLTGKEAPPASAPVQGRVVFQNIGVSQEEFDKVVEANQQLRDKILNLEQAGRGKTTAPVPTPMPAPPVVFRDLGVSQATFDEVVDVNQQLKDKISELEQTNHDQKTTIGTLETTIESGRLEKTSLHQENARTADNARYKDVRIGELESETKSIKQKLADNTAASDALRQSKDKEISEISQELANVRKDLSETRASELSLRKRETNAAKIEKRLKDEGDDAITISKLNNQVSSAESTIATLEAGVGAFNGIVEQNATYLKTLGHSAEAIPAPLAEMICAMAAAYAQSHAGDTSAKITLMQAHVTAARANRNAGDTPSAQKHAEDATRMFTKNDILKSNDLDLKMAYTNATRFLAHLHYQNGDKKESYKYLDSVISLGENMMAQAPQKQPKEGMLPVALHETNLLGDYHDRALSLNASPDEKIKAFEKPYKLIQTLKTTRRLDEPTAEAAVNALSDLSALYRGQGKLSFATTAMRDAFKLRSDFVSQNYGVEHEDATLARLHNQYKALQEASKRQA